MKRILKFTALCVLLSMAASVSAKNLDRSTWVVGGNFDLNASSNDFEIGSSQSTSDVLQLNLQAVNYFQQNLGIGIIVSYFDRENSDSSGNSSSTDLLAGPVLVYNISLGYESSLRLTGATLFGSSEFETTSISAEEDLSMYLVSMDYVSFLSDSVSFDVGIEYSVTERELGSFDQEITSTTFRAGFSVYFAPY